MMHAAAAGSQGKLSRPLMLLATFGEESGMKGAQWFSRMWKGKKPCAALVGEPTSLGITYRHKGLGVLVVELGSRAKFARAFGTREIVLTFRGRQGHSSRPALGENALEKALAYLETTIRKDPRFKVISLEGGSAANLIPGRANLRLVKIPAAAKKTRVSFEPRFPLEAVLETCAGVKKIVRRMARRRDFSFAPETITSNWGMATTEGGSVRLVFDFRLLPGQSIEKIARRLKQNLAANLRRLPGISLRVTIERKNPSLGLKRNHRLPQFVAALLRRQSIPPRLETKPSCTEAGVYAAWGVPSVVFGPGKAAGNIHAPNESVSLTEIAKAAEVYAAVIESVCVKGESCT
jgi:acetylornithine deacetylase/succinyl-diaminopimelate desuccinylase-like protein